MDIPSNVGLKDQFWIKTCQSCASLGEFGQTNVLRTLSLANKFTKGISKTRRYCEAVSDISVVILTLLSQWAQHVSLAVDRSRSIYTATYMYRQLL